MKADLTPLEHVGIAAVFTVIGWLCGDIYVGAAFGAALFIGREHAQAEQRGIQSFYNNRRADAPWYVGFESRVWNLGSLLDWGCPLAAVVIISLIWRRIVC